MDVRMFEVVKNDGTWSKPLLEVELMDVAKTRLDFGEAPFLVRRLDVRGPGQDWKDLNRAEALDRVKHIVDTCGPDTRIVVRANDDSVEFRAKRVNVEEIVRRSFLEWARWGVEHALSIHYSQQRPIPRYDPGHLPLYLDCSSSTITYARWAEHPASWANSTAGNTGTLCSDLRRISRSEVQPGDLVDWCNEHVAIVTAVAPSGITLASHGFEGGPIYISLASEAAFHGGDLTYLQLI